MNAFLKFRADRAFTEGMQAYRDGYPNHAPAHYFEHSSDWVRGWSVAWLAESLAAEQATKKKLEPAQPATKRVKPAEAELA
jgi:phosphosulfolactate synthase (CoM biosynthesis protein A)